jgi:hypothetical protein
MRLETPRPCHNISWGSALSKFSGHELHVVIDMAEEQLISFAEIVKPFFPIRRSDESMLRALSITGKPYLAFPAVAGQRFPLV